MNKKHQRGFTLIELLVVIAIIGILAALVLVALGNARTKANEARIKSNIGQLRTIAEVYYDANNASYAGLETCFANQPDTPGSAPVAAGCVGNVETSIHSLKVDTLSAYTGSALTLTADASNFCIEGVLNNAAPPGRICVDETGAFDTTNAAAACTSATAGC